MNPRFKSMLLGVLALLAGFAGGPPSADDDGSSLVDSLQATGKSSLYRSEDRGATWRALGLGRLGVSSVAIDPSDPSTIYAGTEASGIFKSTDGGTNWSPRNSGLRSLAINDLGIGRSAPFVLHAATSGGLFKSSDGGASWIAVGPRLPNPVFRSVVIDPVVSTTHYAADAVWVAKSVDGGATWTYSTVAGDYVTSLAVDPATPSTIYAGVFHSSPRGGGVYKSLDGGVRWSFVSGSVIGPSGRYYDVNALAVDPLATLVVYAGTGGGGVYRSADGGATWKAANAGMGSVSVNALAVDPRNPSTIYATVDGQGVFKSTDGGRTWTVTTASLGIRLPIALAIDPSDTARVYVGLRGDGIDASGASIARTR